MDKELNEKIIEEGVRQFKNNTIKNARDVESFIDSLMEPLYQKLLDAELENMLSYSKYEHKKDKDINSRNGFCKNKKVQTKYGTINIKTPRDRNGEFDPIIIPKGENRLGQFEDIVLSLCAKGMSYRDISDMLKKIYGVNISKDRVQIFVNTISEVVDNWLNRPLKPFYAFTYADCLYIPVTDDLKSEKKAFYIIIGVDAYGFKEVLGIWCDKTESASFWTTVFEDIKARGVKDILYTTSDGIAGFKGSLETVYPQTKAQRCVVHLSRNLYKICPKKNASEILNGFKKIYTSSSLEIAQLELENFKTKFKVLPKVVENIIDYMEYIEPLFELPFEIRKTIYTSNSIESVNSCLRKVTNGKGSFASITSVYKLLYLRVEELENKWKKPIPNWNIIQPQLVEMYQERYTKYLDL
ncbi:MAG: IS256 family transposase [Clostridia bacterium]